MSDDKPPAGTAAVPTRPAHSTRPFHRPSRLAAAVGVAAALAGTGLGIAALLRTSSPTPPGQTAIGQITASSPMPVSAEEILALLDRTPEFGPLDDLHRRASCLTGLGYPPDSPVLGARPITVDSKATVLLVLPAGPPDAVVALVVATRCSAADTGLVADTLLRRP